MGLASKGGLESGGGVGQLANQDISAATYTATSTTAVNYTANAASGTDAFKVATNGARIHFGAGASDYASSNGTTVTFAGPLTTASTFNAAQINGTLGYFTSEVYASYFRQTSASAVEIRGFAVDGATAVGAIVNTGSTYSTAGAKLLSVRNNTTEKASIDKDGGLTLGGQLALSSYTDDSATPGNRTVNTVRGKNAVAIGATTCVITNSFVTANSQIIVTLDETDATGLYIRAVAPTAGSFTLTIGPAAVTADTTFSWVVIN